MSDAALSAQGTKLKLGSGSPLTYADIPEIISYNGPGGNGQIIDVTDLDSTAIEKTMGLPDEGQLSFNINHIPGNSIHSQLRSLRAAQTLTRFKLVFKDLTEWIFDAYVTGFTTQGGVNAVYRATVTLEISGAITES